MLCDAMLSLGNVRISDLGLVVELKVDQTNSEGYAGTPGQSHLPDLIISQWVSRLVSPRSATLSLVTDL